MLSATNGSSGTQDGRIYSNIFVTICGCLSLVTSVLFIMSLIYLKMFNSPINSLKKPLGRILLPMPVSGIIEALSNIASVWWILHPAEEGFYCTFIAFLAQFSYLNAAFWQANVTTWYTLLVAGKGESLLDIFEIGSHVITWPLSILLACAPFFQGKPFNVFYSPITGDSWCGISNALDRFTTYYLWLFLILVYLTGLSLYIIYRIKIIPKASLESINPNVLVLYYRKIFGYPVIYLLLYGPIILTRLCQIITNRQLDWAIQVTAGLPALNGLVNTLYFGYSWNIIRKLRNALCLNM